MNYDIIVVGGGAAGFFAAINCAEKRPDLKIAILERGASCLEKVRISGGGRCNVTHGEFIPRPLTANYPRGEKELLGPFHRFMTGDTMAWFEERGVSLTIEEDGRVFPSSNTSESIITCFEEQARLYGVEVLVKQALKGLYKEEKWHVQTHISQFTATKVILATGSNPKIWKMLQELGHTYSKPVPSLFTFNCKDERIASLPGLSTLVQLELLSDEGKPLKTSRGKRADRGGTSGALLITHWGFSGPAILKLSAWAARELQAVNYQFKLKVNWVPDHDAQTIMAYLENLKHTNAKQQPGSGTYFNLPRRLWQQLLAATTIPAEKRWADLTREELNQFAEILTQSRFNINGKSTFKEEFVTAGGINLKEVDFKTFASKKAENLYFAGEILDIDAITGGFNFQNAWTGAYLVAEAVAESILKSIN